MNWACRMSYSKRKKKCWAENKDQCTSCLQGKMVSVGWISDQGPYGANAASQIKQMRGFLSAWYILICSSRASNRSYFGLLCFFFWHTRKHCLVILMPVLIHLSWYDGWWLTVKQVWLPCKPESCQLWFVRVLLLLPGHLWPPGVIRRRHTRHSSVQENSWWRSIFQALLPSGSHVLKQLRNCGFVCLVSQRSISTCLASAS